MSDTQKTLELMKAALAKSDEALAKTVNTGTGLVAYDLQAPSKNLYPVNTPIRNRMPRTGGGTGVATNWRVVQAIVGSGYDASGWVAEGQRTARMSLTTANKAANYVTIGEEDQVTFEAINAGKNFEDVQATETMRVLQKMMLKEEMAILGGNQSLALGTTPTPTLSSSGSGGTLPSLTYDVACIALTLEGFKNSSLAGGVATTQVVTGADGQTYTLKGGSAQKSAVATQAVTSPALLNCSVTPVVGAVAYAWFVGGAGASRLERITTINSTVFSAALLGTGQTLASITAADNSLNATLAYDGLITTAFKAGAFGAYVNTLATGVVGTGTSLTTSSRGSVTEIDVMLQSMWDNYQISPTVLYVNSQELKNITNKVLNASSGPLLQITSPANDSTTPAFNFTAGGTIAAYFNPFAMNGGIKMPILIHPNVPAGTIVGYCEELPMQYRSNGVPNTAEVKLRQEYYQLDWPLRTRAREFGVYCEEVLAVYAPFGIGMITNIANG